jgi:ubiquinol-cytochrome c reductase cytochrome c subunit
MRKSIQMRVPVLLILMAMTCASRAQTLGAAAPGGNIENGKKIFASYGCYQCHNYAANGGAAGPRLAPSPLPYQAFVLLVRKPVDQMPLYTAKIVSDKELADIYAFLLAIPAPPAAGSIPILQP